MSTDAPTVTGAGATGASPQNVAEMACAFSAWLDSTYPAGLDAETHMRRRVLKVCEESGEVHGAVGAFWGENPRKPRGPIEDVLKELADCAGAALGAIEHLTGHEGRSLDIVTARVREVCERVGIAVGSDGQHPVHVLDHPLPYGGPGPVHLDGCLDGVNVDHSAPDCRLGSSPYRRLPAGPAVTRLDAALAEIARRRALAQAATPGPWQAEKFGGIDGGGYDTALEGGDVICGSYCMGGTSTLEWGQDGDPAFVAANDPAHVLRVLDAAEATLDRHASNGDDPGCASCASCLDTWPCPDAAAVIELYAPETTSQQVGA